MTHVSQDAAPALCESGVHTVLLIDGEVQEGCGW
jgi:hypothetical protein